MVLRTLPFSCMVIKLTFMLGSFQPKILRNQIHSISNKKRFNLYLKSSGLGGALKETEHVTIQKGD